MTQWLKKYKNRIFAAAAVIAVLAAAFWYGGSSPDSHGWKISDSSSAAVERSSVSKAETDVSIQADIETSSLTETTGAAATTSQTASTAVSVKTTEKTSAPETSASSKTETYASTEGKTSTKQTQPQTSAKPVTTTAASSASKPEKAELYCTFSISCKTILDNMGSLEAGKETLVPDDGVLLSPVEVEFSEGETVFDVLQRVCRNEKIHLESSWTPIYNSAYIEGIGNLYEFDCGSLSGWMYRVNGEFYNYSCSEYKLKKGDAVEFMYTCDLGEDLK